MNETNPKPPPAVRLARVAHPCWPTGDRLYWRDPSGDPHVVAWLTEDPEHRSVSKLPAAAGSLTEGGEIITRFRAWSLDDLALAERRVCEAGHGESWWRAVREVVNSVNFADLIGATAPQRAAALIAFLDAHPAVEERLAAGE